VGQAPISAPFTFGKATYFRQFENMLEFIKNSKATQNWT
jgi:hypothetical protein